MHYVFCLSDLEKSTDDTDEEAAWLGVLRNEKLSHREKGNYVTRPVSCLMRLLYIQRAFSCRITIQHFLAIFSNIFII